MKFIFRILLSIIATPFLIALGALVGIITGAITMVQFAAIAIEAILYKKE